ncbi:MAG: winged helix DNA-binding domain-containing protein [Treponema sp.]|nr:winged helix DNA-binding domain-containing protein [Treponema sp.]
MITLTNRQARQFVLLKHGLLGEYKFEGKQGALEFIRQAGCIQYDPVDICGKNAELVLQSRVKGFAKETLGDLLYKDRLLFDYPDKNLSIIPAEDWPYFARYRKAAKEGGLRFAGLAELEKQAIAHIKANGPVCSSELPLSGGIRWHSSIHWSGAWDGKTGAARAVLEQLYSAGDLVIHHKKGARKYYDLSSRYIPAGILKAREPLRGEFDHQKWRVLRRIGAAGLMWNRPSDAWLYIWGLGGETRGKIFRALQGGGEIAAVAVDGLEDVLYCRAGDIPLAEYVTRNPEPVPRCELIAPLDCFMWDRKLIKALFGFEYTWEIYTPPEKRKYGAYVLPLLYGEIFAGRVEAVRDMKTKALAVKNVWYEDGVKRTKKLMAALELCLKRFAKFNGCASVEYTG